MDKDWLPEKVDQLSLEEIYDLNVLLDMRDDYKKARDALEAKRMES